MQRDSDNATIGGHYATVGGMDGSTIAFKEELGLVCLPLLTKNSGRNPVTTHPASDIVLAMVPINPEVPPPYIRLILRLARHSPRAIITKNIHHHDTAKVLCLGFRFKGENSD